MRIPCPYCGERGNGEFIYRGDGTLERPQTPPGAALEGATLDAWMNYVYLRENPPGLHTELWYHAAGCRAWLLVTRDVSTHAIAHVEAAKPARPGVRAEAS
jgi:heterotetrameric sarcosine oxidase delta subunit